MLFDGNLSQELIQVLDIIHHLGDFLVLVLYPIFVAYALPIKFMKPLTTPAGRYTLYAIGLILCVLFMLIHFSVIESDIQVDMLLYLVLVTMFITMFVISLVGVKLANTKLARERAIAFVCALGFRDLAWATVYSP